MIDYFDKLFTSIKNKNRVLSKLKYYAFLRLIIKIFVRLVAPLYFTITSKNTKYSIPLCSKKQGRVIVSLTSFPARINQVWLVIETILRQTQKPDKIILWLSKEQFNGLHSLPANLLRLQKRGLEIRMCNDDLRSHKKYYYALTEFPHDTIITVDDDIFYNSTILEYLLNMSKLFPFAICANRALRIKYQGRNIAPYISWESIIKEQEPNLETFPIGIGGVLYPPKSMHQDVFRLDILKEKCFMADDIWLNIMGRLNGSLSAKTDYHPVFLPIMNINNKTLSSINNAEGQNDAQLINVINYYIKHHNINPFINRN